jgi:hypothetical protein
MISQDDVRKPTPIEIAAAFHESSPMRAAPAVKAAAFHHALKAERR